MKLLFLGGTQFVGRHMVAHAIAQGHQVSLFNRGRTNQDLFPEAEKLRGDRDESLAALEGRSWDAVIDVNGYIPRWVTDSARLLKDRVGLYIFVSTVSVYDYPKLPPLADESGPLLSLEDETVEEVTGATYGGLKVLCEQAALREMDGRALNLRLGIVAGPHDLTDRVTYWATRVAKGGTILAPGAPDWPMQFIDARDLAEFTVHAAKTNLTGTFNATGEALAWSDLLQASEAATGQSPDYEWIDDPDFIRSEITAEQQGRYGAVPLMTSPDIENIFRIDSAAAREKGMVNRPVIDTIRDILAWDATRPQDETRAAGLTPQLEKELLAKWSAKKS